MERPLSDPTPDEAAALLQAMAEHGIRVSDHRFEQAVGALLAERDALRAELAQARTREQAVRPVIDAAQAYCSLPPGSPRMDAFTALDKALAAYRAALGGSAEADEPASPVLLVPDADLPEPRRGAGPVECCGYHRKRCLIGHAHAWARPWYRDGKLQRTNDTWHCHHCGGVCIAEEDGYDEAAAAPVSVAGDDTQPDGPHLVDAAAPAMREVLRRVELGQLSSASAVDILLDWPSRALAEAGAPAQPDATDETRIEWGVEYSDEGDVDEPISTEEAARSEAVAVLRRFPDQVTSAVVVTRTVRTITTPWQPVDNPVGAALAGAADTEEPTDA